MNIPQFLRANWKSLFLVDLLFKLIAYIFLVPVVTLLFRGFLFISGHDILADVEIAEFFLHPLGWLCAVCVGGGILAVTACEVATLMTMSLGLLHKQRFSPIATLWFVKEHAVGIYSLTSRIVLRLLLAAAPFLITGGSLFLTFLTDHDINFYLTEKPPKFLIIASLIGIILAAMVVTLLRFLIQWTVAIPLHLYGNLDPQESLRVSSQRMQGNFLIIARWIAIWLAINFCVGVVSSSMVYGLGRLIVPMETNSIVVLVTSLGIVLVLWSLTHLLTQIFGTVSFVLVLTLAYERFGRRDALQLIMPATSDNSWSFKLTPLRVLSGFVVAVVASTLIGLFAVQSVTLLDEVDITAHRGASANAPENTLAAIRQAIQEKTDWVEIDVQESKDGVVVVAHDSDLKKVAGENMKIWEATAEELRAIDIGSYFGPEFSTERVPTLIEVLQECRGKVRVNIELKYYGHDQDLERKVVEIVEAQGMANDVVVMSLKNAGIQKLKLLRPDWTVGLLTAVAASDITRANVDFLAVSTSLATNSFIKSAHQRGKQVYVWTVNDAATMSTMIGRGADNLITDHPDLARSVLNERLRMSPLERVLLEFAFLFGNPKSNSVEQ